MGKTYDFSGWATKNDLLCTDGRIIRKDAFKVNNGTKVPLVWNHQHNSVKDVLGHAILENRNEGVYAYCSFNDSDAGEEAKKVVKHGDVVSLSIWANALEQQGSDVLHGVIREVSLVLAGANPGAFIESVLTHGEPMDDYDEEGIFYTGEGIYLEHSIDDVSGSNLAHSDDKKDTDDDEKDDKKEKSSGDKTVGEILGTLNEDQRKAMAIVVAQVIEDSKNNTSEEDDEDEEEDEMKHNIFEGSAAGQANVISHSDMEALLADGKRCGSLREAVKEAMQEGGILAHSIDTTGMETATGTQTYGFNDPSMLFPEYRDVNGGAPEWISRNMDWVQVVMGGVGHTAFSRIKSTFADITEDEARAKGYIKGHEKKDEVFATLKRTTDPQTIYKKQKMDRDDVIDITDFDVIAWIKAEMRVMLNEEIARAILIGDGRALDSEDKIQENHIRPIAKDVSLFNIQYAVNVAAAATDADVANQFIDDAVRARKNYKGSGNPILFTTEDQITEMLLLKDNMGHRLYKTEQELATALRVSRIVTVEPMEGQQITVSGTNYNLLGVIVNLSDYKVGADKGGEINLFEDFDIDYNQQKYLIETRISGALVKPFSAITLYLKRAAAG